ncbi:YlcI/YnfO family protein [Burkholderia sp. S171]|uniref:YlcI/YnfO family protein n=1 Tax=Burkholderia sp. S171 TaxID=1641860 RepID=UPI00131D85D8|nr:YlcI/YnfO family protein [Burkholderia sp. S171]
MKNDLFAPVKVDPDVLELAKGVLLEDESLADFIAQAIRANVSRRQHRSEFVARALTSRDDAKRNANYVSAEHVIARLTMRLNAAKA